MIGYIEAITGIGLIAGPIIGSFLYAFGGYAFTFLFFGTIFFIVSPFIFKLFPSRIDALIEIGNSSASALLESPYILPKTNSLGYKDLLKNPRFTLAAFSGSLGYISETFFEPILAFRLAEFNLT
jgi:MFS family permease